MRSVCLDPGHGGRDTGAVHDGLNEKDVVLGACLAARPLIEVRDIGVVMTRETDRYLDLRTRCEIANEARCDAFVSLHINADPDSDEPGMPEARGEEVWIFPGSERGRRLAEWLEDFVDVMLPDEPFRGIKEARFAVLKHTRMPAALIEVGFIDNSDTNLRLADRFVRDRIGIILAGGILGYFKSISRNNP